MPSPPTDPRALAERVRAACLDAARAAFEDAGLQGLCAEGRAELALDAMERLDLTATLSPPPSPSPRVHVRLATPDDAPAWQALRLRGLRERPTAFLSSEPEEVTRPLSVVAERLTPDPDGSFVLLAFAGDTLAGTCGVHRDPHAKRRHRATLWGLYVPAEHRRLGLARVLLTAALAHARQRPHLTLLDLGVNTTNAPARALYQSFGFRTWAIEHDSFQVHGHPVTEELMTLAL